MPTVTDATKLVHAEAIVAGQEAGAYTLPESVLEAHRARLALSEELDRVQRVESPPAMAETIEEVKRELIEAAKAGEAFPDYVRPIAEVRLAEQTRGDVIERVLIPAVTSLGQSLWTAVERTYDEIVTDHLRPALVSVLEAARKPAATLAGKPVTPEVLDIVAAPLRKAYRDLAAIAERHVLIRAARSKLTLMGYRPAWEEDAEDFVDYRRVDKVWPGFRKKEHRPDPPWPVGSPVMLLAWEVTSEAEPWMPTARELDDRLEEYRDAEQTRMAAQNAAASRRRVGIVR